nr:PREDICTED: protein Wnt-11b-like [Haliaeetus albicilla]
MCRRNLEVMHSIVRAARQTKSVCQKTFADMRWNCSSIQRAPSFGPDLLKASEVPGPDFRWGGCGDNLRYGLQLGTAFADSPLKSSKLGTQALKAMHLHNNAVGRQVLSDSLDTKCKCHGVSGSCSVKTCWKGLPNLDEIASDLKSKYLAAIKVTHRLIGPRKQLIPKEMDVRPVKETDLVYLNNSPDYCTPNLHLGSLGTQDRSTSSLQLLLSWPQRKRGCKISVSLSYRARMENLWEGFYRLLPQVSDQPARNQASCDSALVAGNRGSPGSFSDPCERGLD